MARRTASARAVAAQVLLAATPARDRADLLGRQRSACVDAQVVATDQRGEGVDASQPLDVEVVACAGEVLQCGVRLTSATVAQLRHLKDER